MQNPLVPLKFIPTLHTKIWGGKKIVDVFGKNSKEEKIGESWEISTVPNYVSVVESGPYAGKNLNEVIQLFESNENKFLGSKSIKEYGNNFPLLIKYIDADEPLSIQVHPNDSYAQSKHNSMGKTEMWYIMEVEENAKIIIGFKKGVTSTLYDHNLKNGTVEDILHEVYPKPGDVFFIPAGRVHAIGKGITLAEIQQTSDITYRIYDYNRKDDNGEKRELHLDHAYEVMDFSYIEKTDTPYILRENAWSEVVHSPFFNTDILYLKNTEEYSFKDSSFTVYMCVEGAASLEYQGEVYHLKTAESLLVPAGITSHKWIPENSAKLLKIRI